MTKSPFLLVLAGGACALAGYLIPQFIQQTKDRAPEPAPAVTLDKPSPQPTPAPAPDQGPPFGTRVPGRPDWVTSPHAPQEKPVDVSYMPAGMEIKCPYTNKLFRVPPEK